MAMFSIDTFYMAHQCFAGTFLIGTNIFVLFCAASTAANDGTHATWLVRARWTLAAFFVACTVSQIVNVQFALLTAKRASRAKVATELQAFQIAQENQSGKEAKIKIMFGFYLKKL